MTFFGYGLLGIALSLGSLAGCGGEEPAGSGAGAGGDAGEDALSPAHFDCTAKAAPERRTPVPPSCALDSACKTRLASAHRGAGAPGVLAPEDSLAAVRAAIAVGADFTECDPRPTLDEVMVLMHDADVDRTTDGTGAVADKTLADLQQLHLDSADYAGDFSCERVPRLTDVLALARGKIVVILDASKSDRLDLLVNAIHQADALDWTIFDSDDLTKINDALALEPKLNVLLRATDPAALDAGLKALAAHPPVYVHIDNASPETMAPLVHDAGQRVFALGFTADVAAAISQDPATYAPLYESGVDIVQSNRPDLVARFLGR